MKNMKMNKFLIMMLLMIVLIGTVSATPKVILTFDDGDSSVYLKAFPIMKVNNQPGVAFIITGRVPDASGKNGFADLNLTQIKNLYSNGWDISSHTVNHEDLTKKSTSIINKELSTSKNWLESSGFTRSSRFFAYPFGGYNSKAITAVKNNGYLAARTTDDISGSYKAYKLSDPDILQMKTTMVYPFSAYGKTAESPETVKKKINDTISQDGLLILSFHIISDVCCVSGKNDPGEYKTSDFKIISDYLKEQEYKGKLDVVTMSEYFTTSTNPSPSPSPTPSISPTPSPSPNPSSSLNPSPSPIISSNITIETNKSTYNQGENVQFTIYNNDTTTFVRDFKPSILNNTGNCVWGCFWIAVYNPIIVPPGENRSWTWDQKGANGQISPGIYKVRLGEYYSNEFEIVISPQQDILAHYRALGKVPNIVETSDLLKAADDWRDDIIPPGCSAPLTTDQLLILADEWRNS